jgi:hypothetical protein
MDATTEPSICLTIPAISRDLCSPSLLGLSQLTANRNQQGKARGGVKEHFAIRDGGPILPGALPWQDEHPELAEHRNFRCRHSLRYADEVRREGL